MRWAFDRSKNRCQLANFIDYTVYLTFAQGSAFVMSLTWRVILLLQRIQQFDIQDQFLLLLHNIIRVYYKKPIPDVCVFFFLNYYYHSSECVDNLHNIYTHAVVVVIKCSVIFCRSRDLPSHDWISFNIDWENYGITYILWITEKEILLS